MYSFQKGYVFLYIFILLNIISWIYTSVCNFKRSIDAKVIFFGSLFLLLASIYDISFAFTWHYIKYNFLVMSVYGSLVFCIVMIFLVVFKYLDMQVDIALESEKVNSMYQLAIRDGMTGIYNHQYIVSALQETNQMYSLLMIDVDNLKKINDTYGHLTGDKVIKCVADIIKKHAGEHDVVGRYGGDEFAMILFDTAQDKALYLAQQVKTAIEEAGKTILSGEIQITLSIGIYTLQKNEKLP
jgi:diguanylate cyclase (GGDEF)-like protein